MGDTKTPRVTLPVSRAGGGVLPGVNLDCMAELLDIMEAEELVALRAQFHDETPDPEKT